MSTSEISTNLDRVEVGEHILKLLEQEKTRRHTLSARNCVWRGTGNAIVFVFLEMSKATEFI